MKLSEKEWQTLRRKAGITEPDSAEQDGKKQADFQILMDLWQVQDRQWLRDHKEALKAEHDRKQAIQRQQRTKRHKPIEPMALPIISTIAPAMPLRFDSGTLFRIPERLIQLSRDYMNRFRY